MKAPIVIIGIGELGSEFARGFLRCGHPVFPVTRQMNMLAICRQIPHPELVLITVQENELQSVLKRLPDSWKHQIGLLQNELLPRDWQQHNLTNPTVAVVWFEKKPNMVLTNILYTPVFGPQAILMTNALDAIKIPSRLLQSEDALLYELVRKSVYILTVNICGLYNNCSVGDLWEKHQTLARDVAQEVILIQEWLTGVPLSKDKLIAGMVEGIKDCPDRNCLGRSAHARLQRTLAYAREAGIETPTLDKIDQLFNAQE